MIMVASVGSLRVAAVMLCIATSFWTPPAEAHAIQTSLDNRSVMEAVASLRPGEFIWAPQVAPEGPVLIIVSLATQRLIAYRNGIPIGVSTVSTGMDGHETPAGVFTILQKNVDHRSNIYDNAPMPYMQRLTWDGIALHAGNLPGHPASHGCIRLPLDFARHLYGVTRLGLTVIVTDEAAVPRVAPAPDWLRSSSGSSRSSADAEEMWWRPDLSPTGPLSIVISGTDRRLVVLRNGRMIGSGPIAIEGRVVGTSAYTLRQIGGDGSTWMRLPLPGQPPAVQEVLSADNRRFRVPDALSGPIRSVLVPGTTVVVTADTLRSGGTGQPLQLLAGEEHP